MILLTRSSEPDKLSEKKVEWLAAYKLALAKDPKKHPHSSTYAHKDIVDALERMSFQKCFYCEQSIKAGDREIDHYVEVAEHPDEAFVWSNLGTPTRLVEAGTASRARSTLETPTLRQLPPCQLADPCSWGGSMVLGVAPL
jgi:hypothetical protein